MYLLDTHTFLWWLSDDSRLSTSAASEMNNPTNEIMVSSASAWEICTKFRIGKLPTAGELSRQFAHVVDASRFTGLSITLDHAQLAGSLPSDHRDPFDRMLAAQAILENIPLITKDSALAALGCKTLW
jgi:PIN domain nuclease of toxin-antitoxin system